MDRASKAALLSALVFPGAGHLYLRLYLRGLLLALIAAVALYFVATNALEVVRPILQELEAGQAPPDIATLTRWVMAQMQAVRSSIRAASFVFLACWAVGILDAFRAAGG